MQIISSYHHIAPVCIFPHLLKISGKGRTLSINISLLQTKDGMRSQPVLLAGSDGSEGSCETEDGVPYVTYTQYPPESVVTSISFTFGKSKQNVSSLSISLTYDPHLLDYSIERTSLH